MCTRYHEFGIACHAGYILGFPTDTPQTIAEDVETLKGIGLDQVSFFVLTPLPGSEDHIRQYVAGVPMDRDLNNYDSFQPVIDHPLMSRKQWQEAYNRAWRQFYTPRQMTAALRRISKNDYWGMFRNFLWYRWSAVVEGVHPMMAGFLRREPYASRQPSVARMSRTEHILREIWRFVRYIALGVREFFLLATGVLRKLLRWACWRRRRSLGSAVPEMAHGSPSFAVVRANVRARGAPGVVERLLEALCKTRMEAPPATPMGLACQSLLVRDDGGGLRHPFQYGGAGPTSASEQKHRISGVVSKPLSQSPFREWLHWAE